MDMDYLIFNLKVAARWQSSRERSIAKGSPQGKRGRVQQFGVPPKGNANYDWKQQIIHHLAPQGMSGFVLANGSMTSIYSGEGKFRGTLIDCVNRELTNSHVQQTHPSYENN